MKYIVVVIRKGVVDQVVSFSDLGKARQRAKYEALDGNDCYVTQTLSKFCPVKRDLEISEETFE